MANGTSGGEKSKTFKRGELLAIVLESIKESGKDGIGYKGLSQKTGSKKKSLEGCILKLKTKGYIVATGGKKGQVARYYSKGNEPPRVIQPGKNPIREANKRLPDGPVIVPENVKVTRGPDYIGDTRYIVTEAPRVINAAECREWAR